MNTLQQFSHSLTAIPLATGWLLNELGEYMGRQQLFTKQAPQRLKTLREHALIESAVSSNRIEGVEVDQKRVATLIFGQPSLRDRDEEELRGYRNALNLIHTQGAALSISEKTIKHLHALMRGDIWDAGRYKNKDGDIIERYADGRERVRFKPLPAKATPKAMTRLVAGWRDALRERVAPPLVLLVAFNLDFLCIHPFRDGNGRVSRLLFLLQCYHLGIEVGRYISLERLIEENKERYYETLEQSSRGWHDRNHKPWPFINYALFILKQAYKEFERRVGQIADVRGAKTALVLDAIARKVQPFAVGELQRECPSVSLDLIRRILKTQRGMGAVQCLGRGRNALWSTHKSSRR